MMQPRLKHFGWGREGEGLTSAEETFVFERVEQRFGPLADGEIKPPRLEDLKIETPRLNPPASLPFCSTALYDRAAHTYGKSFPDYVRGLVGDYSNAPDVVAYPRTEEEIVAVLDWAGGAQASVTPFGGGSSVVGGVEPRRDAARHKAAVTIDLRELGRVLEIDKTSRAARIEAGAFGPALEAQLKPHGLTLRHFPQSFECSTLGGWIATRSGGHFATLYTHIDDLVELLRVITPMGVIEMRRLPGSGAGPSPDRLSIGSEGILGIITPAGTVAPPSQFSRRWRSTISRFFHCRQGVGAISQAGLYPANCRILDAEEAFNTGAADGNVAMMVLAFESGDHPVEPWMKRAYQCCVDHGAAPERMSSSDAHREGAAGAWRNAFIRMPFARERTIQRGTINDTFDTPITWERFDHSTTGSRPRPSAPSSRQPDVLAR